ncbi:MAG: sugar phosphate nucleotidyltransferase [Dehalococcoidia bacterium]|nr:sugar phosphate nucleotidyltransferase [Dehalococcoidia bacterium]
MPEASRGPVADAVIIAAGRGTRMRPATRVVPKEFLLNYDRPLLHNAIDEAVAAGCTRVTIVTSDRSRPFLERYFAPLDEEEARDPRMAGLAALREQVSVTWVEQPEAKGTGNATLYAREAVGDRPFLLMLPDMVFTPPTPGANLVRTFERLGGSVISVTEVGPEYFDGWGMVDGEDVEPGVRRLRGILEKPGASYPHPSGLGINGRYVLTPGIFDMVEEVQRRGILQKGEVNLTDAMVLLAEREPFFALVHQGPFYDSGLAPGVLAAAVATAIRDPEHGEAIRADLRAILEA